MNIEFSNTCSDGEMGENTRDRKIASRLYGVKLRAKFTNQISTFMAYNRNEHPLSNPHVLIKLDKLSEQYSLHVTNNPNWTILIHRNQYVEYTILPKVKNEGQYHLCHICNYKVRAKMLTFHSTKTHKGEAQCEFCNFVSFTYSGLNQLVIRNFVSPQIRMMKLCDKCLVRCI